MKANSIIIAGIAGTTAFTLFSYLASKAFNEKFEEPELLGKLIERLTPSMEEEQAQFTGWLTHYLVGIGFAAAYNKLLLLTGIEPSVSNGIITGASSGYPASLMWNAAFKHHPLPPRKRSFSYNFQLIIGHAIFGAVAFRLFHHFDNKRSVK